MKTLMILVLSILILTSPLPLMASPIPIEIENNAMLADLYPEYRGEELWCFSEQDLRDIGAIMIERNEYRAALQDCTADLVETRRTAEVYLGRAERAERRVRWLRWLTPVALLLGFGLGASS